MKYLMSGLLLITCFYVFLVLVQDSKLPSGLFGQDLGKMISRENITEILRTPDRNRLLGFNPTFQEFSITLFLVNTSSNNSQDKQNNFHLGNK